MMKDELIDNLNAKIERDQKSKDRIFNLLGINRMLEIIPHFRYPEMQNLSDFNLLKSFLRSFS